MMFPRLRTWEWLYFGLLTYQDYAFWWVPFSHFAGSGINLHSDCVFTTLKGISLKLKEDFEKLFKQCADKITEMCVAEKTLWLELDQLEEKCHNLVADVQGKTHDLVCAKLLVLLVIIGFMEFHPLYTVRKTFNENELLLHISDCGHSSRYMYFVLIFCMHAPYT